MTITTPQPESLQEFTDSRGATLRVDRAGSLLQGVKLLGLASRNGRRYREAALRAAAPLYEGAKVNVNHPQGDPASPRDYRDRLGVIRAVRLVPGEGLFGSLQYNPKHPLAEQLMWDAEHAPENVGLSHNVLARTTRDGGDVVVESIDQVRSVDLVADPATTHGLFEQAAALPAGESFTEELQVKLNEQQETIEQLTAQRDQLLRRQRITELLVEHGLPLPGSRDAAATHVTSETFLQALIEATDDAAVERLMRDRAQAVQEARSRAGAVTAREQTLNVGSAKATPNDAPDFVRAITSR